MVKHLLPTWNTKGNDCRRRRTLSKWSQHGPIEDYRNVIERCAEKLGKYICPFSHPQIVPGSKLILCSCIYCSMLSHFLTDQRGLHGRIWARLSGIGVRRLESLFGFSVSKHRPRPCVGTDFSPFCPVCLWYFFVKMTNSTVCIQAMRLKTSTNRSTRRWLKISSQQSGGQDTRTWIE